MTAGRVQFLSSRSLIEDHPELIGSKNVPFLRATIWVILVGSAIFLAQLMNSPDGPPARIYSAAGFVIFAAVQLAVLHYRGVIPTLRLLSIGAWILVTYASFVGEGIRSTILIAYPIILIFTGWILGARSCARLYVASCLVLVILAIGQHTGFIGGVKQVSPAVVVIIFLIELTIGAVMTLYLLRLFGERYAEEYRLRGEVEQNLQVVEKSASDLRMLAEHIPALVFEVDRNGRCIFGNQRFAEFLGIPLLSLPGSPIGEIIIPSTAEELNPFGKLVLPGKSIELVARRRSAQGAWHTFDVTLVSKHANGSDTGVGWYGLMHDVTQREQTTDELRDKANHDPLTGLANRRLLDDRLVHALERAARQQTQIAVIMIDLDRFKEVNDTLGHVAGDDLLREVAQRIKSLVRSADTVARVGGDEFVVLMEDIASAELAQAVAAKILVELSRQVLLGTNIAQVGASLGIAIYPGAGHTSEALLQAADGAMYEAKAAGRNCYHMHAGPG